MKRRRKKKSFITKKKLAVFGISLTAIIIAFIVVMGIGGLFPVALNDDTEEDYIETVDKETGKINILIAGLDKGESRTDTIMVASYNLDDDEVKILSIPRDTRMYIGGRYQKINSAHTLTQNGKKKGINGTIEAVSRLTGIPINYYVEFSCEAFRDTIDALDGVDFDVPQNMNYDDPEQDLHIHLKKGFQHLDGDHAEQLVRFRRYPMGDIDRVSTQQKFIKAVAEQKLNASIISKVPQLYKSLSKNVNTNFTIADITKYAANLADLTSEGVSMYALPGTANSGDYGASYWIADMTALADLIQNTFGYDASEITIHSADGRSTSKDVKVNAATSSSNEDKTHTPAVTNKPVSSSATKSATKATPKPTAKATVKPQATHSAKPEPKASSEASSKPTTTQGAKSTQKPTEKPDNTKAPTASKSPETAAPTARPTKEPVKTEAPADTGVKRPETNPTE